MNVGDKLYSRGSYIDNMRTVSEIKEYTIESVGTKYYTVQPHSKKINKTTLKHDDKHFTQSSFQAYRTKEEILEMEEAHRLFNEIKSEFSFWRNQFSVKQIKEIRQIVLSTYGQS